jgi:RNA polymerase sigma factor (sigma-70 family)
MAATYADEVFERLYARYGREVYRYALTLLRNPVEAEDVTQTTFLNAYRALRAGARPRRPHNWLIAIAHNACRSRVRFVMRRPKEVPLDDVVEQLAVPEAEGPNIRELLRTIRRLPINQRAAITMREFEGRSYVDIAETLGVTVPAAEALIGRARRTLRERAAAFRSLLLAPLPRSLRKLGANGEAGGGALGTAAAAKIAALVVVGAVGGGVGLAAGSGSQSRVAPVERSPAAVEQQRVKSNAPAATPGPHTVGVLRAGIVASAAQQQPQIAADATTDPAVAAAAAAATATAVGAAGTQASATPRGSATDTLAQTAGAAATTVATSVTGTIAEVTKAVTTVVSELPTVTAPSATTPPVTTPTVSTPVTTAPPVTVPPVTVPTVTVPTVTVPPIP